MNFGEALSALKNGERVARAGWNGKGMWLKLIGNDQYTVDMGQPEVTFWFDAVLPWIGMKTADNKFVPWLASQTDVLAEDWSVVS